MEDCIPFTSLENLSQNLSQSSDMDTPSNFLSRGFRKVYLETPQDVRVEEELSCSQPSCSQEPPIFCTPDFITPVEQQFTVQYDPHKENAGPRSPCQLSPIKNSKRQRLGTDDESMSCSQNSQNSQISTDDAATDSVGKASSGRRPPTHLHYVRPNTRTSLASLRRRVQSPPCHANPFLLGTDHAVAGNRDAEAASSKNSCISQSRYRNDFHEMEQLGRGSYGKVMKAVSRMDGCTYAIKRSAKKLLSVSERREALQEVQALAAVGSHPNIIRYFAAWFESDHLYIQTELCSCSLSVLRENYSKYKFSEEEILDLLRQMSSALQRLHSKGMAHLDVKPDNIFMQDGMYKLGDFGHVTTLEGGIANFEEGDSRYMAAELLRDDYSCLDKADMFALGATAYELAKGVLLPTAGAQYQALRQGRLTLLPDYTQPFQKLLQAMMHEHAHQRPSSESVGRQLCKFESSSKAEAKSDP